MTTPFPLSEAEARWLVSGDLGGLNPILANALTRRGYDARRIWGLNTDYTSAESWHSLHDIPNIGPARLLYLVNFFRKRGLEAPWFADFDRVSARWRVLEGRKRLPSLAPLPPGPDQLQVGRASFREGDAWGQALRAALAIQGSVERIVSALHGEQAVNGEDVRYVVEYAVKLSGAVDVLVAVREMREIYEPT